MRPDPLFPCGTKDTTTTPPFNPYQWRADGRTRDDYLRAAGLGTSTLTGPPPRVRPRKPPAQMTRDELAAVLAAKYPGQVTP